MPVFARNGISFNYLDLGAGQSFVFQHGLGGDVNQPSGLYHPVEGIRLVSLDCRGHGETYPLGPVDRLSLADFADDLIALFDHLEIQRAVIGGISMGAAIALNCGVRYPDRVSALVLSRPAWFDRPHPSNLAIYDLIASLIHKYGPVDGLGRFVVCSEYQKILELSTDAASSLVGQFQHPRAAETVAKLECLPHDSPVHGLFEIQAIRTPTLVLANRLDPIHPYDFGMRLAHEIPGASFHELTPKSVSREQHASDVQNSIDAFLQGLGY